jgi:hypothetical protein
MNVDLLAVFSCGVVAMILGAIWYGPLFGKKWVEIIGATEADLEARKEMQKKAGPLYAIQFVLVLFQVLVLARFIGEGGASGIENALWIWAGFVMPTIAAASMWNNDSREVSIARFLIQAGYQLILFIIFGFILGLWA